METISYPSNNGVSTISAKLYIPVQRDIIAVLQISHGMCEHIERYKDFAQYLCSKGFVVCGNDHLGHKNSVTSDEQLGFFAENDGHNHLVNDIHKLTVLVKSQYPGTPYFLLGHSMGSFVARCCLASFGGEYDGAILSGTGGKNPLAPAGKKLAELLCKTQGAKKRSKLLDTLVFGSYNSRFKSRTGKEWLTRNTAVVDAYLADKNCMFLFTNSAMKDSIMLTMLANTPEYAQKLPRNLPIYLFSGTDDPVGDYGKGVQDVYDMIKKAGVFDVTLKLYKGGRHEMLNETNSAEVYDDIYEWIKRKT